MLRAGGHEKTLNQLDQLQLVVVNVRLIFQQIAEIFLVAALASLVSVVSLAALTSMVPLTALTSMVSIKTSSTWSTAISVWLIVLRYVKLSSISLLTLRPERLRLLTEALLWSILLLLLLRLLV